jgi:hypothetical protein
VTFRTDSVIRLLPWGIAYYGERPFTFYTHIRRASPQVITVEVSRHGIGEHLPLCRPTLVVLW